MRKIHLFDKIIHFSMQFSAVLNIFIVKTKLNSTFTNDLKRKYFFSKNVHSYRVCSFKQQLCGFLYCTSVAFVFSLEMNSIYERFMES